MRLNRLVLALALLLAACNPGYTGIRAEQGEPSVRFLAFGDAGTGTADQAAVGQAMAQVCAARGCDFALELGDNIYESGAKSADDPQFETAFEQPYAALKIPVYVTLGNHDNGTDGGEGNNNARGNYEVAYHYRTNRSSDKWHMPARYYSFLPPGANSNAPLAEFFSLDSNPLAPYMDDPNPAWSPVAYSPRQLAWLQDRLAASKAKWKIAFAHHPYISHGWHGDAGNFDLYDTKGMSPYKRGQVWKDFFDHSVCAQGVDLFFAGHDHDLEWLKPVTACGKTQFIVSGTAAGGKKKRPFTTHDRHPVYWQADNVAGFFWLQLKGDRMTVAAYTLDANNVLPKDAKGRPLPAFEGTAAKH